MTNTLYHRHTLPANSPCRIVIGPEGEQGTPEWLAFRKHKMGSSTAATIMGVDPWKTQLVLWEDMLLDKKTPVNRAMQRGKDEEPKARKWFNEWQQRAYEPVVLQMIDFPNIIASLDGYVVENGEFIGVEIKAPGLDDHLVALSGQVPEKYLWQIYHQMMVSGAKKWWYLSWDGEQGICIEVGLDLDKINLLFVETLNFMSLFETRTPPKTTERDRLLIQDSNMWRKAVAYICLDKEIREKLALKEEMRKEFIELAKTTHPRISIGDALSIQRVICKGTIDYSRIPQLQGVSLEEFRKEPIEQWRIDCLVD